MKVKYNAEADILIFIMLDQAPANAIAEPSGVIVSYSLECCTLTRVKEYPPS